MTPHTQLTVGNQRGSCFATAIASVLDLPIDAVPNFVLFGTGWLEALSVWAWEQSIHVTSLHAPPPHEAGPHVVGGPGPRKTETGVPIRHAVVVDRGVIVSDPHPSKAGIDLERASDFWLVARCPHPNRGACGRCGVSFGEGPDAFVTGSQTWRRGP